MKTIGIIGGFSPEATARFYLELVRLHRTETGTQPRCIVWNASVSEAQEQTLLLSARPIASVKRLLIEAAQHLEQAGADLIVLPCNTLHVFASSIQDAVRIPFVDIIKSACSHLHKEHITTAGLLGSGITLSTGLFTAQSSITFFAPKRTTQRKLNAALHESVRLGNNRILTPVLDDVVNAFVQSGIRDIVLACTDFGNACTKRNSVRFHDTLTLLAHEVMNKIRIASTTGHAKTNVL